MPDNGLKILHVTPMYPTIQRPAFGIFVKSQIESLKEYMDIEVMVLPGRNGILPYLKSIPKILRGLRTHYDVVHVHFGTAGSLVKLLNFRRKKIVTSYCGGDLLGNLLPNGKYQKKSILFKWINIFFSKYDGISVVKSQELGDQITNWSRRIEVVPNGVNIGVFKAYDRKAVRKELGIPDDGRKILLFPADSDNRNKNFPLVQNALENIDSNKYHMITFKGKGVPFELVPKYMSAADLVVFTSLSEGSPNVIKESMAANCRIFSTPCGDVEWLLDSIQGSRVIDYDQGAWDRAITDYMDEETEVSSNSREMLIKKGIDLDSVAEKISQLYQELNR